MNGITRLQIGGQERVLRFNNFAMLEVAKVINNSETAKPESDIYEKLMELSKKNHYLLIKVLIYSGIIGNDYVVGFEESVTIEEVGNWVGELNDKDTLQIWDVFWDASGAKLSPDPKQEDEEEPEDEKEEQAPASKKKITKPTKKRYRGPSGKSV